MPRTDESARQKALELDLSRTASDLVAPLLIVFGRLDRLIPWENAVRLRDAVSGPVTMLMLEGGNHGVRQRLRRSTDRSPPTGCAARLLGGPDRCFTTSTASTVELKAG